jgi:hypothetical protein
MEIFKKYNLGWFEVAIPKEVGFTYKQATALAEENGYRLPTRWEAKMLKHIHDLGVSGLKHNLYWTSEKWHASDERLIFMLDQPIARMFNTLLGGNKLAMVWVRDL